VYTIPTPPPPPSRSSPPNSRIALTQSRMLVYASASSVAERYFPIFHNYGTSFRRVLLCVSSTAPSNLPKKRMTRGMKLVPPPSKWHSAPPIQEFPIFIFVPTRVCSSMHSAPPPSPIPASEPSTPHMLRARTRNYSLAFPPPMCVKSVEYAPFVAPITSSDVVPIIYYYLYCDAGGVSSVAQTKR
jgi:hypothetical protein